MEIAIPGIALGLLYVVVNQNKNKDKEAENFTNKNNELPNTDIPNKNYPNEIPVLSMETEKTSNLSHNNRFENAGGVYTDKYFNANMNNNGNSYTGNSYTGNGLAGNSYTGNSYSYSTTGNFYSLTGEKVDGNYFQHNNMVPFFGSNSRSSINDSNSSESILDNYVGAGSQLQIKKEAAPMFAPQENTQWSHGAPNMSDFYQSRVNPSARMANVKPFAEQKVAPGLGLGYTNEGSGGFNSGMMMRDQWTDRNVDELRVANNPKPGGFMLYGHEGPSNSIIKSMADSSQMGVMEKNRPERAFEMFDNVMPGDLNDFTKGKNYLMTTTGLEKGQTMRSIPTTFYKDTVRQVTNAEYAGGAGYAVNAEYTTGEYMPTHNIQLESLPLTPANAKGRNFACDGEYQKNAKIAYPNNRTENNQDTYYGMVSGGLHAAVAPLLDMLRPSRRENIIGTLRPYQNPGTTVPQSYIFNPEDKLVPTIRETTDSKFHMNVNRNQNGGAYSVTEHQTIKNNRETTDDFYYGGISSAGPRTRQMKSYEAEYNQRNNDIKSATVKGYTPSGNMSLLNGSINMRQSTRDDYLANDRPIVPTMPYQTKDIANMGQLQGQNGLYSGIHTDRNSSDIYDALKGNPYVVNYKAGI
jgi:hypothetical protein